ncbi:hypothetical protein TrVE_jg1138 [Triparma verrucosa]|uniref:Uncharacterized protein n=1 Tax=Triparma verrucosa TaxID=1606542 RepID=A0A9W7KWX9_9STRA|nr:hypothetical protein TrVE_jg1138 [Triparma verrucosa]
MFSPTSLNDEDQNVGLTEEELAELEAELDADLDGSDSDSDGHSWDALEEKLKTALHESEPTQQSSSALSNLAGFEQFAKSSTAMGEQMQQYSSDLAAMKESGGVAAASMLSSNSAATTEEQDKLLSMADVFELALGAATRGAVAYLLAETEARHTKEVELEKARQLEEVKKAQATREEEINRQNELRRKEEEEKAKAVKDLRAQQQAKEEEHRNKMKQQMLELERAAHEEMEANKKALEEKRRKNKEQRVAIMEAEERRWTLASKAVGFVQSRLRGLMGRKTASKRKKQLEQAKEENQRDGSDKVFDLVYSHFSKLAFLSWKLQVKTRIALEQKAAVNIQATARRNIGLARVVAMRTNIRNNNAAIRLQTKSRSFLAKQVLASKKTAKAVADEQQRAREEAARKFQEEQRRKEAEERKRQNELRRIEAERKALAEIKAKEEKRKRDLEEQAKSRRDAERIIDANLFGSPQPQHHAKLRRGMAAILQEREDRKQRAVMSLKGTVEGFNLPPQRRPAPVESSPPPHPTSSSAQQIEDDMLYGLGAYGSLQTLKLDVEHIEDASNLERLGVTALTSLSLNVNKLASLQTIGMLKKLERLSLRDNKVTSLEGMKTMQGLVELLVDVNQLTSLETLSTSCWFNLTTLSANTNRISSLPANLSAHLPCLSMLNLYQNNLESLCPTTFQNLPSLTSLDLGRNKLKDAEALGSALSLAPTLRKLVLSQNKLTAPPALTLPLLQQLWLSSNNISTLVAWKEDKRAYMPCLLELYLQENAISMIGGEGSIGNAAPLLDKLDLTFNQIEDPQDLAGAIRGLEYLRSIEVQDNPITTNEKGASLSNEVLKALPNIRTLNGVTVNADAKWVTMTRSFGSSAAGIFPALKSFMESNDELPIMPNVEGAAEMLRGEFMERSVCASCGLVNKAPAAGGSGLPPSRSRACTRCFVDLPPPPPVPLCVDWPKLLRDHCGNRASSSATGWSELCKKINTEAAKMRSTWRKKMASESRSVRQEAMVDHVEMLKDHLGVMVMDEGSSKELWGLVVNKAFELQGAVPAVVGSLRRSSKVNTIISAAATMRIQCFIRRFLAAQRAEDLRTVRVRHRGAALIQSLFRGRKTRNRLKDFGKMKFDYVDEELEDMLGEDIDMDMDMDMDFGIGLGGDVVDDEAWKPTKPVTAGAGVLEVENAWRTPSSTPAVGTRDGGNNNGGNDNVDNVDTDNNGKGSAADREISSPFGGLRSDSARNIVSQNMLANGFNFLPPTTFQNTVSDDMEIKSVTTVTESVPDTARSKSDSRREQKEAELMKDWGLTDSRVAQAMMKRAKKMNKGKKAQAKKAKMKDALYRLEYAKRKGGGM